MYSTSVYEELVIDSGYHLRRTMRGGDHLFMERVGDHPFIERGVVGRLSKLSRARIKVIVPTSAPRSEGGTGGGPDGSTHPRVPSTQGLHPGRQAPEIRMHRLLDGVCASER